MAKFHNVFAVLQDLSKTSENLLSAIVFLGDEYSFEKEELRAIERRLNSIRAEISLKDKEKVG